MPDSALPEMEVLDIVEELTIEEEELNIEEIDQSICNDIDDLTQENNQIWSSPDHDRREYVHGFFQYPAMMVPVVQKKIIEILIANKPNIETVLDPYMGSGTSLVACMENGLDCYGQDVNPLAVLVSQTRTGPFYFNAIEKKKDDFFDLIDDDRSRKFEADFPGLRKWFKSDVINELSKIVRAIKKEPKPSIRKFYWVILAETVRLTSNDRTSTFKLHARKTSEIEERQLSPIEYFKAHFENCLEDIRSYAQILNESDKLSKGTYVGHIELSLADSKDCINTADGENEFFDLLVTSPPYGDNKTTVTYGQHSYLPLQWIDLKDIHKNATEDYIRTTSEIDNRGLGGKMKNISTQELQVLYTDSPTLQEIVNQITAIDATKVKKVVNFFYDIHQSISNIHTKLKVNSYQVWTIGNRNVAGIEIPNTTIMGDFIQARGAILIKSINREILNKRMARRNNTAALMTYEDILIFRKIGN